MATTAFSPHKPVQTTHAQERVLERCRISLGQLQQMIEAKAYATIGRGVSGPGRKALAVFSPLDDTHVLVWQVPNSGALVTVMPFSYQNAEFRTRTDDTYIEGRLRRAKLLAMSWLTKLGQAEPVPSFAPRVIVAPSGVVATAPRITVQFRLAVYHGGSPIDFGVSSGDALELALEDVIDQRSLQRKLAELLSSVRFIRLVEAQLVTRKLSLENLLAVKAQLRTEGRCRPFVSAETPFLDCLIADLEYRLRYGVEPLALSDVFDCEALKGVLPFACSMSSD